MKIKEWNELPQGYIGNIEWEDGTRIWFKNGNYHRENGPAFIRNDGYKEWFLDGKYIWNLNKKLGLINKIILSKTKHPKYPTIQIWKILDENKVYEQLIIPGMEELIIE